MQSFLHPWLLVMLAAAVLPPIIEWLFRRRKRQVELPTIRFLLDNQEQKKVRRQDQLLLLLRMAAIFLLVLGIARPLWNQAGLNGPSQRNVVLLLDATASMNQQLDVSTSFALAQKKAAAVIRSLPAGTVVTVASFSDRVTPVAENETDLHTVAARVESLRAGCGAAAVASAVGWVRDSLKEKRPDATELYIFSDFQRYTWQRTMNARGAKAPASEASRGSAPSDNLAPQALAQVLDELGSGCETYFVDVGGPSQFNLLVTHLRPAENVQSAGMPVTFQATVESRGDWLADARVTATFLVDGVKKDVRDVSNVGTEGTSLSFDHVFPKAGEYLVEVAVDGDRHLIDNRRLYLCRVPDNARVLIVDDSADTALPASSFFARAVRPPTRVGVDKLSHFDVKTVHPARLSYENLSDYVVVVLAGSANLSDPLAAQLERFVSDGGSLWFFLGDAVNAYDYERLFYKGGGGLLPCVPTGLETIATTAGKQPIALLYGESTHSALTQLARTAGSSELGLRRRMKLSGLDENANSGTQVIVQFSDNSPAIVEKSFGRGRVLLANLSIGTEWSFLPALAEFPLLVQGVLSYLVGDPDRGVNLNVGEPFVQPVFVSTQHLLLRGPHGAPVRLTPQKHPRREGEFHVTFADTSQPGLYEIDALDEVLSRRKFVVNHETTEGELDRLSATDVAELFPVRAGGWIPTETVLDEFTAQLHTVTELTPWVLSLLATVLVIETWFAWRFGRRRATPEILDFRGMKGMTN